MVPMHAEKRKGALHEPPGEATGPTGCRPGPLTRRSERFMVPMHAKKRKGALHEPQDALLGNEQVTHFEVHGPNAFEKRKGAFHEPQGAAGILPADQSEKNTAGKMP